MKEIVESLGVDYGEYLKVYRRLWNRLYRGPRKPPTDKNKLAKRRWIEQNRHRISRYKKRWDSRNVYRNVSYKLKYLSKNPEYPMSKMFISLDATDEHLGQDYALSPLELLIMKEEAI